MNGPAWRRHLRAEALTPDTLVLLSDQDYRFFSGTPYAALAPLLDGCRTEERIQAELEAAGVPAFDGRLALSHLRGLGLLRQPDGTVGPGSAEDVFWDGFGADSGPIRARLAASRVDVTDLGGAGTAQVREALGRCGLAASEGERVALNLVVVDDELDPRLAAINRAALVQGRPWMIAKLAGTVAHLGPLFQPHQTGCWACLAQRLRLNREVEAVVEAQCGPGHAARQPSSPATLALFAELATLEITGWLVAGEASRLVGGLIAVDLKTNAIVRHGLVRRPQCEACGSPDIAASSEVIMLPPSPKLASAGGRSLPASATLERYGSHISPLTGVVRSLHETREGDFLHVAASHAFPMHRYDFKVLRDNYLGRSGGKGFDPTEARVSALCEALERISGTWRGEEERVVVARRSELGAEAVDTGLLFGFSAAQYAGRDQWNAANDEPHAWMPRALDPHLPIEWVKVPTLAGQARFVPAAFCYYGHPDQRYWFCSADSNGCAAGSTFTEAVAHGLLELVERDAAAIWWYNRLDRPAIDLDSVDLPLIARTRRMCEEQGRVFWALWLTTDIGVPVVAAISARVDDAVEDIVYGFGSDFSAKAAVGKAVSEMNQSLFSVLRTGPGRRTRYRNDQPAALRWFRSATRSNQPYLGPADCPAVRLSDVEAPPHDDWQADVLGCAATLERRGLLVLVLDQTRPDIGLPVVRVIVPGLCHFWRRFGLPRLYDVPVAAGWRDAPTAEADLNPWFIYF